jgi:hypothetical protein
MNVIGLIFPMWVLHVVLTLLLASPVLLLGRRRAHWERRDLLALILPFAVWLTLMFSPLAHGKTFANALNEGLWMSAAIVVAALVRVWMSNLPHRRRYFPLLLAAVCVVGVIAFITTPPLPE